MCYDSWCYTTHSYQYNTAHELGIYLSVLSGKYGTDKNKMYFNMCVTMNNEMKFISNLYK